MAEFQIPKKKNITSFHRFRFSILELGISYFGISTFYANR